MIRHFLLTLFLLCACQAQAAPGAHGPNGEHLDTPASISTAANAQPTIEANTEAFELVGTLAADELSVMVDRYATNEPVLDGTLEVEFSGIKAQGKLHADFGDYSFTDEKLLKALHQPGKHALVFTLLAGNESDLIEGSLTVAADARASGLTARWLGRWPWIALVAALTLAAIVWRLWRRHSYKKN